MLFIDSLLCTRVWYVGLWRKHKITVTARAREGPQPKSPIFLFFKLGPSNGTKLKRIAQFLR
jgi:hypothetical protein